MSNPIIDSLMQHGPPPLGNVQLNSRFKNKFEQGFLGGTGSDSQFQGVLRSLPVLPARNNNDLASRILDARGDTAAGVPLMPSWERSYAWHPGLGTDAYYSGITWTSKSAGMVNPVTGLTAPLLSSGQDRTTDGPMPQEWSARNVGLAALKDAPVVSRDGPIREAPKHTRPPVQEVRVVK